MQLILKFIIISLLFAASAFCMNDKEFKEFPETLREKYGIDAQGGSSLGLHLQQTDIYSKKNDYPDIRLWLIRPYRYEYKAIGPHKHIGIRFSGEQPPHSIKEIKSAQKNMVDSPKINDFLIPSVGYQSWIILLTNDPAFLQDSIQTLEVIYGWNLISNQVYSFILDELNIPDLRLQNYSSLLRRICKKLVGVPTLGDLRIVAQEELVDNQLLLDAFLTKLTEEIREDNHFDIFLDSLMSDYYMAVFRLTNMPMLIRRINQKIPINAVEDIYYEIIKEELELILCNRNREWMTYNLLKNIKNNTMPAPDYFVKLCDLIPKDSQYYQRTLELKGQAILVSEVDIHIKDRYSTIINSCIEVGNTQDANKFITAFISNNRLGKQLPVELQNLDYSHRSFMNLLDHIRKLNLELTK